MVLTTLEGAMIINRVSIVIGSRRKTIAQVAKEADVSYEAVRRLYEDISKRLDLDTLNSLCRVLECQPGDLFEYKNGQN